jgi:ribosomal protein L7Ae-like RNA K-turn-binding protein
MSKVLHMLSIARKAGKLEVGEEPAGAAARAHQAKLLIIAKDAAENTYRRVRNFANVGNTTWVSVPYTKAELGGAIGRTSCALIAVMDVGIAASIVRNLAAEDPEKFTITMERMDAKAEKALRRQKEKRQHEKNLKNGKYQHKQAAKAAEAEREQKAEEARERRIARERKEENDGQERRRPNAGRRPGQRSAHKPNGANRKYRKKSGRSNRYESWDGQKKPTSGPRKPRPNGMHRHDREA